MYAMVDCNSFYCSCERLFDPGLHRRPVIVLSNNDGCAVSRSDEAKALGIEMGTPEFMISEKVRRHNIAVFSSNYTLYQDISDRVMQTIGSFVPGIEVYSIDEAFLDMHDMPYYDLLELSLEIRNTVLTNIGIPVCVGIAPTKTLAKMANRYAKKFHQDVGVFYAANERLTSEMLLNTPVSDIWGIGKKHAELLRFFGFTNAAELAAAPDAFISKHLSVVGLRLVYELRGIGATKWEPVPATRKNICTSRSFGQLITDKNVIAEALSTHAGACARKLREERSAAAVVHVFLQTNPHRTQDRQYARSVSISLPVASNDNGAIIKAAAQGLDLIFHEGFSYKKCGVIAMELVPEDNIQSQLFEGGTNRKMKQLMHAVDQINRLKGRDSVRMGVQIGERSYRLRANHLSRHYTTDIKQLPEITRP